MPPAPGRLSVITCCPSNSLIFCATTRAVMSPTPPGPNGTRKRIGRDGNVCAPAPALATTSASASAAADPSRKSKVESRKDAARANARCSHAFTSAIRLSTFAFIGSPCDIRVPALSHHEWTRHHDVDRGAPPPPRGYMIDARGAEFCMALKLRKLSYALGTEVCDVDVGRPMSEQQFGEIYRAFLDHNILLFRGQDITREQHIEFSRRFGELDRHDSLPRDRHKQYPELLMVTNEPKPDGSPSDTKYTGRQWHTDMSFTTSPSLGSLLKSWAVPEVGGDTLFANLYLAYDTLSDGMKKLISGLHGIHLSGTRKLANDNTGIERQAEQMKINPPVAQPVVRVHPETGRKALYLGEKVKRFDGMTEDESGPLIDFLNRHPTRPELLYRHQW